MYEAICCQTDISAFRRRTVQTDVEGLAPEEPVCPSTVVEGTVKVGLIVVHDNSDNSFYW